jgi:diaminohydroxyphosphoribosylaminopyrimidine deaminase/5-amino-6-(5-phosphoribosylamino)uracil reductase
MSTIDESMMQRCLQLAALGMGGVAPNPMVGAVLVHEGLIIGEGYHKKYGQAHAEVNCVDSVPEEKRALISRSTLYVSLEPCSHYGKTPPCTELIISRQIPRVVVGCTDPFAAVSGRGIDRLRAAGVEVTTGVLEPECIRLNKRFFTFHQKKRPYIILKWAQSADGLIALPGPKPVKISQSSTDRLVHRWRSEEAGIMVGSHTALCDDPRLTNRLWTGASPVRIVIDRELKLPGHLKVFDNVSPTLVFNLKRAEKARNTEWVKLSSREDFLKDMLSALHQRDLLSVIVEGGAQLLQSFIDAGLWDEARVITGNDLLEAGLRAPALKGYSLIQTDEVEGDQICFFEKLT